MRRGKEVAQGAHAATQWLIDLYNNKDHMTAIQSEWLHNGQQKKICVQVESEKELDDLHTAAVQAGLICHLIVDYSLTEFKGIPTKTCLAIGPDDAETIDKITGHLPLR